MNNAENVFCPGEIWLDTNATKIQGHHSGMLVIGDVCYWYGADMSYGEWNHIGVTCYTSRDLYNWKYVGVALPKTEVPEPFRDNGVCERSKVLYNAKTEKYVMWTHLDNGTDYRISLACMAIAERPEGPFRVLATFRPIRYDFQYPADEPDRQKELGSDFRDHTLFLDDDGSAYVFYAAEGNATMYVSRLNPDFTGVAEPIVEGKTRARILVGRKREAPAVFKWHGKYIMITSACTGWAHNAASYAVASSPLGP